MAKSLAKNGIINGSLIIANEQISGRGRRGRTWISTNNLGISMSIVLRPDIIPRNASMLTLVAALALSKAISNQLGIKALIKWPNDIIINNKKVCGILTEMSSEINCVDYVIIGIGINVNNQGFPEEIEDIATSLFLENNKVLVPREQLISNILYEFENYYEIFLNNQDLSNLYKEYSNKLINIGMEVVVDEGENKFKGTAKGINSKGELLVEINNDIVTINSGEVSVRGICGYV